MSNVVSSIVQRRKVGSSTRKSVLSYLADRASDDGSGVWTSKTHIAADTELSKRSVQNVMKQFEDEGLLEKVGTKACASGFTFEYRLVMHRIQALPSTRDDTPRGAPASRGATHSPQDVQDVHPKTCTSFTPRGAGGAWGADSSPHGVQHVHPNHPLTTLDDADDRAYPHDHSIDPQQYGTPAAREQILAAIGADPISGISGPNGNVLGTMADMQELSRWQADLGLTLAEVLSVVGDVMRRKSGGPPVRFSYFTKAMQEFAGRRNQERLEPIAGAPPDTRPLPENWIPSAADMQAAYDLSLNDADIKEIANDFRTYWAERAHTTGRKSQSGWEQTWRQRCRDVAPGFIRNRGVAGKAFSGGYGRGRTMADIVAQRQYGDQI